MKNRVVGVVLVSALGVGAVSTVALTPAVAATAQEATTKRLTDLRDALKGLVTDGTLTAAEADKVAAALDKALPHREAGERRAHRLTDLAAAVGLTEAQLRSALQEGKTLAQVAQAEGISKSTLIDRLVAAANKRLDTAVSEGKLTQAEADQKKAGLRARITEAVDRVGPRTGGPGHSGRGGPDGPPMGGATPSSTSA